MGIVSRFERKLQGAVGDAFARVFGGNVVPQEVESALQREAADNIQELDGGHLLAPNSYIITINESDHEQLAADQDLTIRAFSRHLADYIREQGWQTYGEINVAFEASPTLHTGQFRTRGRVDPDAGRGEPTHQARPSFRSGVGPMTQHPGYDPAREPGQPADDNDRQAGFAPQGRDPRRPQDYPPYRNGRDEPQYPAAPEWGDNRGYSANYQDQHQGYPPASYPPGYSDRDYGHAPQQGGYGYSDPNYGRGYEQGYNQPSYDNYGAQPGYADPRYGGQPYGDGYDPNFAPAGATYSATLQLDDGSGRTYQLREGSNIIGRGQDAHFRLPDTGVSRRHIEIRWDGQVAMLSDLGSTNGTLVNGAPVQDWQLADGDIIRAGHSEILIRIV
ncbi:DUF2662 domain-containing protein [Skermania sp. ID1734]|uniref:FhaA domain-containing protein n=1 Tax=Skermania sp. ID1734 TaxID=2597516 RepID=UPI00117D4329|nr:FhaA domain-containing protein [Skermania sp. ID1734]TSD99217.1 DUF2662 domain-containing protein [Skermania sp. ID1734]